MIKKSSKFFTLLIAIALVVLCFQACSSNKKGDNYVTAKLTNTFSASGDMMSWADEGGFFIEKDGVIKSHLDYGMGMGDSHFSDPVLDGDYLYYEGGSDAGEKQRYIARINHTEERPKVEKLTDPKLEIYSFTVLGNKLYYTGWEGPKHDFNLYVKNLLTKREKVMINKVAPSSFCTNGSKIITGNEIFDVKTKKANPL